MGNQCAYTVFGFTADALPVVHCRAGPRHLNRSVRLTTRGTMSTADRRSPESVVQALYEVISGSMDVQRDWPRLQRLFTSSGRLRVQFTPAEGPAQTRSWTPEEFAREAEADYHSRGGFWEREVFRQVHRFGSIAHVWSVYESRQRSEASEPFARGINSVQLVREEDGWAIENLLWDIEQPHNPIAREHLPPTSAA
jgi:hypothetical protein